jgi:hypothetical protein
MTEATTDDVAMLREAMEDRAVKTGLLFEGGHVPLAEESRLFCDVVTRRMIAHAVTPVFEHLPDGRAMYTAETLVLSGAEVAALRRLLGVT